LEQLRGHSVRLVVKAARPETREFGNQLESTLTNAGIIVERINATVLIKEGGGEPAPGVSLGFGINRFEDANLFGIVMVRNGIEDKPLEASRSAEPDNLTIYVAPRQ
jgi:hypothetical protein